MGNRIDKDLLYGVPAYLYENSDLSHEERIVLLEIAFLTREGIREFSVLSLSEQLGILKPNIHHAIEQMAAHNIIQIEKIDTDNYLIAIL